MYNKINWTLLFNSSFDIGDMNNYQTVGLSVTPNIFVF